MAALYLNSVIRHCENKKQNHCFTIEKTLQAGWNRRGLDHLTEKVVDLVLPVAEVSALDEVVGLLAPSTGRGVQLEGPEEV